MRSKTHALFMAHRTIVHRHLHHCSLSHEERFEHARCKITGFTFHFIHIHIYFHLNLLIIEAAYGKFIKLELILHFIYRLMNFITL